MQANPETPEPLLMTYGEAAKALRVSDRTVWSLVKRGTLPAIRVGSAVRIDRRDVLAFIDRQRRTA